MTRLVRLTDDTDPGESVMVLGGEHGVVTVHVSLCGTPQSLVLHSPREREGWDPALRPCSRMELPCWYLSSARGSAGGNVLDAAMALMEAMPQEGYLWALMQSCYVLYLEGGRG